MHLKTIGSLDQNNDRLNFQEKDTTKISHSILEILTLNFLGHEAMTLTCHESTKYEVPILQSCVAVG